ncbi:hypothetical protein QN379_16365 [Glaciimonas sp. Gout2]|uniref:hypothetical protein n=1 Tax=unclassified Glaciimonas TaxID=2644401 RepID=UPI002B22262E|nr:MULTISPECIES: hypothetical protein [unclassified Glaciimonas]MEB0013015.1 hypothetical protein [Glaciimonas sp. Cout2]MEB0083582.1 hypothetical protein [Glaciimonas sp. Gout2]
MTPRPFALLLSVTILLPVFGCVTRVDKLAAKPQPITPLTLADRNQMRTMLNRVIVRLDDGYSIMLMEGSHWMYRGTVPGGSVYEPKNGALETDDKHPKEFDIVTSGKQMIGLYFPNERRYTPLRHTLYLVFQD